MKNPSVVVPTAALRVSETKMQSSSGVSLGYTLRLAQDPRRTVWNETKPRPHMFQSVLFPPALIELKHLLLVQDGRLSSEGWTFLWNVGLILVALVWNSDGLSIFALKYLLKQTAKFRLHTTGSHEVLLPSLEFSLQWGTPVQSHITGDCLLNYKILQSCTNAFAVFGYFSNQRTERINP